MIAAILADLHTASNALDRAEAAGDFDMICALRADLQALSEALNERIRDEQTDTQKPDVPGMWVE